jgi:transcriptional regulator with XRE-family HTH domain
VTNLDKNAMAQAQLGKKVKAARTERGLSQAGLAAQLEMSRVAVAEIEAGRRKVSSFELAALSRALLQPTDYFIHVEEPEAVFGAAPDNVAHLARTAKQLTPGDQEQLLRFAEYLKSQASHRNEVSR